MLYVVVQYFFGFFSVFSGQPLYEPYIYQLYNITFTGLPIMWYATMDFEFEKSHFLENPMLYRLGLDGKQFGYLVFWKWIFYAVFQSAFIIFVCLVFNQGVSSAMTFNGLIYGFWASANFVYCACVLLANLVLLKMFNNWTIWGELLLFSNALFFFVVTRIEAEFTFFTVLYKIWEEFVASPAAWLGFFLVLSTCWLVEDIAKLKKIGL